MTGGMLIAIALQAALVPPAPPQPVPQPPATILVEPAAMFVAACDQDHDGRVTRAELATGIAQAFATADGAQGGSIGYIAYADWAKAWLGDANALPSPYEVDADGDNRITLAELQAKFGEYFTRYDLDRDGVLTRAELVTIRASAPGSGDRRRKR